MAKPITKDLPTFLNRQAHGDLVTLLLELAQEHDAVHARLACMQLADQPVKLAVRPARALFAGPVEGAPGRP